MARSGPAKPREMKTLRSRCGVRASALPPSFRSARSFTSAPVAPAILSPVTLPTASSTERKHRVRDYLETPMLLLPAIDIMFLGAERFDLMSADWVPAVAHSA
jgi:hypothetical protein